MHEETRRVLLSLREKLVSMRGIYSERLDNHYARIDYRGATADPIYWSGNTNGLSVAISRIDEEMRRLDVSGKEEGSTGQEQV